MNKLISNAIAIAISCLLLSFLSDNTVSLISGFKYFDFGEYMNELVYDGKLLFDIAVIVYSVFLSILWELLLDKITTIKKLLINVIASSICLTVASIFFWQFIYSHCYYAGASYFGEGMNYKFGSINRVKGIFTIFVLILLLVSTLIVNINLFIKDTVLHLSCLEGRTGCLWAKFYICYCFPMLLILLRTDIITVLSLPLDKVAFVLAVLFISLQIIEQGFNTSLLYHYYEDCRKSNSGKKILVRSISEQDFSLMLTLLKKAGNRIKALSEKGIWLIRHEIAPVEFLAEICIDVYESSDYSQKQIIEFLQNKHYNTMIVYSEYGYPRISSIKYNYTCTDIKSLLNAIDIYVSKTAYTEEQIKLAKSINTNSFEIENSLTNELMIFKNYLLENDNKFFVFDTLIKWLEIVNYFYTLVLLNILGISVARERKEEDHLDVRPLELATFGDWQAIRNNWMKKARNSIRNEDNMFSKESYLTYETMLQGKIEDNNVLADAKDLYKSITTRDLDSKQIKDFGSLLQLMKTVRDYTRGHGVFTFEITDKINLELMRIIVSTINNLVHSNLLADSLDTLQDYGWIVIINSQTYYLYSYDPRYSEYDLNSYSQGITIKLPADFRGNDEDDNKEL